MSSLASSPVASQRWPKRSQALASKIFSETVKRKVETKDMEKFIVRRPRSPKEKRENRRKEPKLKQATIKSLARVVVVEDIFHLKSSLEAHRNDSSPETLVEILERLKVMNPSTQVLKHTKVGRTVNSLRRCDHQSVRDLSRFIIRNWKKLVEDENTLKESIDVRCDAKTELLRCKAKKLIASSLDMNLPNDWTEALEKRLFQQCQRRVDNKYKRSVRSLVFLIKSDTVTKANAKNGTVSPQEVLSKCLSIKK